MIEQVKIRRKPFDFDKRRLINVLFLNYKIYVIIGLNIEKKINFLKHWFFTAFLLKIFTISSFAIYVYLIWKFLFSNFSSYQRTLLISWKVGRNTILKVNWYFFILFLLKSFENCQTYFVFLSWHGHNYFPLSFSLRFQYFPHTGLVVCW